MNDINELSLKFCIRIYIQLFFIFYFHQFIYTLVSVPQAGHNPGSPGVQTPGKRPGVQTPGAPLGQL